MNMHRIASRALVAVALTLAPVLVAASEAHASEGATQIAGLMQLDVSGACPVEPTAFKQYVVSGDLVGCWYIDTLTIDSSTPAGTVVAHGTEHFDVCLGARCGTLFTTITFTGKFDGSIEDHGRCHHPVVGGTDGFAGASGEISMHDISDSCVTYHGALKL
jgi:hypothetical protein